MSKSDGHGRPPKGTFALMSKRITESGALRRLNGKAQSVFIALTARLDWGQFPDGVVRVSQVELMAITGASERSVRDGLRALENESLVEAVRDGDGRGHVLGYRLVYEKAAAHCRLSPDKGGNLLPKRRQSVAGKAAAHCRSSVLRKKGKNSSKKSAATAAGALRMGDEVEDVVAALVDCGIDEDRVRRDLAGRPWLGHAVVVRMLGPIVRRSQQTGINNPPGFIRSELLKITTQDIQQFHEQERARQKRADDARRRLHEQRGREKRRDVEDDRWRTRFGALTHERQDAFARDALARLRPSVQAMHRGQNPRDAPGLQQLAIREMMRQCGDDAMVQQAGHAAR